MGDPVTREGRWVWCSSCKLLPWRLAVVVNPGGQYIPFKHLECSHCGRQVDWVCRGDESVCEVREGVCMFHRCYVSDDPRKEEASQLVEDARRAERVEDNRSGLWHGPSFDGQDENEGDPWPTKGGIFE